MSIRTKKGILAFIWFLLLIGVFFSSFKEQVFIPKDIQKYVGTIFPEGWGFFTKNPRDPLLEVYKVGDDFLECVTIKNQSADNLFGFSRKSRIIGYESSVIANKINPKNWSEDEMKNLYHLKKDTIYNLVIENNRYLNKGLFLLISYEMIPFAWSNDKQEPNNPVKYVYVNVN